MADLQDHLENPTEKGTIRHAYEPYRFTKQIQPHATKMGDANDTRKLTHPSSALYWRLENGAALFEHGKAMFKSDTISL